MILASKGVHLHINGERPKHLVDFVVRNGGVEFTCFCETDDNPERIIEQYENRTVEYKVFREINGHEIGLRSGELKVELIEVFHPFDSAVSIRFGLGKCDPTSLMTHQIMNSIYSIKREVRRLKNG